MAILASVLRCGWPRDRNVSPITRLQPIIIDGPLTHVPVLLPEPGRPGLPLLGNAPFLQVLLLLNRVALLRRGDQTSCPAS